MQICYYGLRCGSVMQGQGKDGILWRLCRPMGILCSVLPSVLHRLKFTAYCSLPPSVRQVAQWEFARL